MSNHATEWLPPGHVPRIVGRRVLHFSQVVSTNAIITAQANDPENDGLVVLADEQTAGRGRMGRSWSSPPLAGILCSVLLFPPEAMRRPAHLTVMAAVGVCVTIFETTQLRATIKWPNDVYLHGKKVCGVLVEQLFGATPHAATIIGIGLNVNTSASTFAAAGLDQAGSLAMMVGRDLDRRDIIKVLLRALDEAYADLLENRHAGLEARWRDHSGLLGRNVLLETCGQTYPGKLLELSFDGIVLEEPDGSLRQLQPEAVTHLRTADHSS